MTAIYNSGQRRFFHDFLLRRRLSSSTFVPKEYFFDESSTPLPAISMDLHEMMNARVSTFLSSSGFG